MSRLTNKSGWWLVLVVVFLSCAACTRTSRIRGGGSDTLPPTIQSLPSDTQLSATATPAGEATSQEPTQSVVTQPPLATQSQSDQATIQGDALENMLKELEGMNQSADGLADVP